MKRFAAFVVLALLAACAKPREVAVESTAIRSVATSLDSPVANPVCRVGPDGGPVPNDPTMTSATPAAPITDRGIGGTGTPQGRSQRADRGIGGTGIVGVITGFASICVNGLEVAYDNTASVDIDGSPGTVAALRAGQVVVILAGESAAIPVAQTISVRHQVTGKIESVELATGTLTVAGQTVLVPAGTQGANSARLGDWVAISGLRRADGALVASRLDPAHAGTVRVHGQVVRDGDMARVGQLVLAGPAAADLQNGQFVIVSGQYAGDQLHLGSINQDPLFDGPGASFGKAVNHLVLQAFVHVANGMVVLNGAAVTAGPGVSGTTGADGIAIVSLERKPDGTFTAIALRYAGYIGSAPGLVPNISFRGVPVTPPPAPRPGTAMASLATGTSNSPPGDQLVTSATTAAEMAPPAGAIVAAAVTSPPHTAMASTPARTSLSAVASVPPSLAVAMPPATTTTLR